MILSVEHFQQFKVLMETLYETKISERREKDSERLTSFVFFAAGWPIIGIRDGIFYTISSVNGDLINQIEKIWQAHQSNEINNPHYELTIEMGEYYWWIGLVDSQLLKQRISHSTFLLLSDIKNKGILPALEGVAEKGLEVNATTDLVISLQKGRLILL